MIAAGLSTDVAKDAADVILLEKDLDVLADGIGEGRRIFANTITYALMGTSSNFGNMFSAAGASVFLSFLPMLPSDPAEPPALTTRASSPSLPTRSTTTSCAAPRTGTSLSSGVHAVLRAAQLDLRLRDVRRHAVGVPRGGSAVQVRLVRRVPGDPDAGDLRHPDPPGPLLPQPSQPSVDARDPVRRGGRCRAAGDPLAGALGFEPLPLGFFATLGAMVVAYLALIEVAKHLFYTYASGAQVSQTGQVDLRPDAPAPTGTYDGVARYFTFTAR